MTGWWPTDLRRGEPFVVIDATVVDGTGQPPHSGGYVAVRDGRVEAVGPLSALRRSDARRTRVVDAGGRTVLPGLIDCHTHLVYAGYAIFDTINRVLPETATIDSVQNARRLLRAGYTTVRDVGTIGFASVAVRDAVAARKIPGPRVLAGGRSICTTAGPKHEYAAAPGGAFRQYADGPDEVVKAVRVQVRGGVDNVKLVASGVENNAHVYTRHTTMSEDELRAGVHEAHRSGRRVAVHAQSYDSVKFALRAGADTVEHGTRLDEEAIELFQRGGAILVPTLSTLYSVMEFGESLRLLPKQRDEMAENRPLWLESFRMARAAGIRIAAGGDIGNRYRQGENARELELLVTNGMTPLEAIQAATGTAAEAIGRSDVLGTLEPGKVADMLIVDADPLADISVLRQAERISVVLQSGCAVAGSQLERGRRASPPPDDEPDDEPAGDTPVPLCAC